MALERYPRSEHPDLYKGGKADEAISKMMRDDPQLKQAIEEAYVERILLGDKDSNAGNFVISKGANGKYKVKNIDLDYGFGTHHTPELSGGLVMESATRYSLTCPRNRSVLSFAKRSAISSRNTIRRPGDRIC